MSVNYAAGLSEYENKGRVGMREIYDSSEILQDKLDRLAELVRGSRHLVVNTGAGVSTAAGIPDFRGPKGVWTLEKAGKNPSTPVTFASARPTFTHAALVAMEAAGILQFLISQNVDGLHMRSGFPRDRLAELHGNMFLQYCERCGREEILAEPVPTMRKQPTGLKCSAPEEVGCRGRMRDCILDWEDELPEKAMEAAMAQSRIADLNLVLGSSLQIEPANKWPLLVNKNGGNLVIVNLQKTKRHKQASLVIHAPVDEVMRGLCQRLRLQVQTDLAIRIREVSVRGPPQTSIAALPRPAPDSAQIQPPPVAERKRKEECEEEKPSAPPAKSSRESHSPEFSPPSFSQPKLETIPLSS